MEGILYHEDLRKAASSIFATKPFPRVSDRYAFVPTIDVVDRMVREGYVPVAASQNFVRMDEKRGFQRHMVRFRREEDQRVINRLTFPGGHHKLSSLDVFPEVILTNSHDATTAFKLNFGMFRLICTNGLVVASGAVQSISLRHAGNPDEIVEAAYKLLGYADRVTEKVMLFNSRVMNSTEMHTFAVEAARLRYGFDLDCAPPIESDRLLDTRRNEDEGNTLWNVYNRVQENLMKGGQDIRVHTAPVKRHVKTRTIKAVGETLRVNTALWGLAETFLN